MEKRPWFWNRPPCWLTGLIGWTFCSTRNLNAHDSRDWYHSTNRDPSDPSSLLPVHCWSIQRAEDRSIHLYIYIYCIYIYPVDNNPCLINQYITTNQIIYVLCMDHSVLVTVRVKASLLPLFMGSFSSWNNHDYDDVYYHTSHIHSFHQALAYVFCTQYSELNTDANLQVKLTCWQYRVKTSASELLCNAWRHSGMKYVYGENQLVG